MNTVMNDKLTEMQKSQAVEDYRLSLKRVFDSSVIPTVAAQVRFPGLALSTVNLDFSYDEKQNKVINTVSVGLTFPDEVPYPDDFYIAQKIIFTELFDMAVQHLLNR